MEDWTYESREVNLAGLTYRSEWAEKIKEAILGLTCYRPGLVYSGFDGREVGETFCCQEAEMTVYTTPEENIGSSIEDPWRDDPYYYAERFGKGAIAVYDPQFLRSNGVSYDIIDRQALLAIVIFETPGDTDSDFIEADIDAELPDDDDLGDFWDPNQ